MQKKATEKDLKRVVNDNNRNKSKQVGHDVAWEKCVKIKCSSSLTLLLLLLLLLFIMQNGYGKTTFMAPSSVCVTMTIKMVMVGGVTLTH